MTALPGIGSRAFHLASEYRIDASFYSERNGNARALRFRRLRPTGMPLLLPASMTFPPLNIVFERLRDPNRPNPIESIISAFSLKCNLRSRVFPRFFRGFHRVFSSACRKGMERSPDTVDPAQRKKDRKKRPEGMLPPAPMSFTASSRRRNTVSRCHS